MRTCHLLKKDLEFLHPFISLDEFILRQDEIKKLQTLASTCGGSPVDNGEIVQVIVTLLNMIFETTDARKAFEMWDRFLKKHKTLTIVELQKTISEYRETGRLDGSFMKGSSSSENTKNMNNVFNTWYLISGLMPFVPVRIRSVCSFLWDTSLYAYDGYTAHAFEIECVKMLVGTLFPVAQGYWILSRIGDIHQIVNILTTRNIRGLSSLLSICRKTHDALIKDTTKEFESFAIVSGTDEYFKYIYTAENGFLPKQPKQQGVKTTTHPVEKKTLTGKHSTALTKSVNKVINSLNERLEQIIVSSPLLRDNAQYVPLALSIMYGIRKSVVIDKYETLVRTVNNFTRRKLGQKIRPTKTTPLELLLSGAVRPILRRDLLLSNILILLAYMKDDIAHEIKKMIGTD